MLSKFHNTQKHLKVYWSLKCFEKTKNTYHTSIVLRKQLHNQSQRNRTFLCFVF